MNHHQFEYDEAKSLTNKDKHGIDFDEATALWDDSKLVCLQSKVITDEIRLLFIGQIRTKHWTAVVTKRGDNLRIISVRRSRKNEVSIYES
ncbi:toxin [Endozoicomonas montiporae]|uniref:Toxin n=2 Tax=Endozoicomonas montiporae TaxID=1027273 RepID=A0A081N208_9GAMM|nr:BrnT family toxin [Endozoicomonas montiporae]AMO58567.1 hypothetical protein EZMO1_4662 [Endozoicomonas montiporae CL-33]KEQ12481.1 toxin [Endozoicomonas montiporae]